MSDGAEVASSEEVESVESDDRLSASERETIIRFDGSAEVASIFSEDLSVMRALLRHPEVEVSEYRTQEGARLPSSEWDGGRIVAVWACAPIGLLKVQASSRSNNRHSHVVSDAGDGDE